MLQLQVHYDLTDVILRRQVVHFKQAVGIIVQEIAPTDLPVGGAVHPARENRAILGHLVFHGDVAPGRTS